MFLSARSGFRGLLINLDTRQPIRRVKWCDTDTGEYEAFLPDEFGRIARDEFGRPLIQRGKARIKFVPANPIDSPKRKRPDPIELLPRKYRRLRVPLFDKRCENAGCSRVAEWSVSDEVKTEPEVVNGRKYARARTVKVHWYCSFHYQPPRILDDKGEVVEVWEEAGGVRPE